MRVVSLFSEVAKRFFKSIFALFAFSCIGLIVPTPAIADTNFTVDLVTNYRVDENALSSVEHQFTITNKTPAYFINRYGLKLSSKGIKNVTVLFNNKPITAEVVHDGLVTSIGIEFPEKIVGEGKQLHFTVKYQNPDNAQLSGQILEVTIPKLANATEYNNYSINLYTPVRFGQPVRSAPTPSSITTEGQMIVSHFKKIKDAGISAIFGSSQIYQLNLQYQLDNPGSQPVLSQITLPPDTQLQRLNYQKIDPSPLEIKTDADGNWIATYRLEPNTDFRVLVSALAQVRLDRNTSIPESNPNYNHFSNQDYWEIENSEIKTLAETTSDPESIYKTVVETLEYTTAPLTQNLKRLGALGAMQEPLNATCQEYTDLFIALARANGIPSRRATGYSQTQDSQLRPVGVVGDILHSWPEYFDQDQKIWIPIDPTWGDTTGGVDYFNQFDLNHVVFAYQGSSSTLPYPAGSYRPGSKPEKLVEVTFADSFPQSNPDLAITIEPKKIWTFALPGMYELVIKNRTGMAWHHLSYLATTVESEKTTIKFRDEGDANKQILPFQTLRIPVTAYNTNQAINMAKSYEFTVKIQEQTIASGTAELIALPAIVGKFGPEISFAILGLCVIAITLIAGSIFVLVSSWKHPVRR